MDHSGVGLVDEIAEIDGALLRGGKDGAVVGEVAFDMPVAAFVGLIFGGGSEIDVGGAEPDVGSAVILDTGADREVGGENDGSPRAGTSCGRRVGETLGVEIIKDESLKEDDGARRGRRVRNGRIGGGGIAGSNLQLSSGDG